MAVQITKASIERLAPLASVLGRSFVIEPMMLWSLGDHDDIADRLTRHFERSLEGLIPLGVVWEAGFGLGAAIWFPPDGGEAWQEMQETDDLVVELTQDAGRRYREFWDWVASRLPTEPVWHLDAVASDPNNRGQGIGSALIQHGLALALADGAAATLETGNPRNVPYYQKQGFRIVAEDAAPGGGPTVWFLRKDP